MTTIIEEMQKMMQDSYENYKKAMKDQNEANKYRANFWKGKYEGHRESLLIMQNNQQTKEQ